MKKTWNYFKNGWNWTHLMGAIIVYLALYPKLNQLALLISPIPTMLKEVLDEITCRNDVTCGRWGFDVTGGDYRDIYMAIGGGVLGFLIRLFI